jgi:histone acetyltransferase SAS3
MMTSASLMEQELQKSVVLSEDDAEYENDDATSQAKLDNASTFTANAELVVARPQNEAGSDIENHDMHMADADRTHEGDHDEDLEDEDEEEDEAEGDDDEPFEDAVDGEEDNVMARDPSLATRSSARPDIDEEDDEEDEDEGVGAVKIKPGETDDEEDDIAESGNSDSPGLSDEESDGEEAWEEAADNEDEDESDTENTANCMFCKQDEEHDPSEEFEAYLACSGCNENGIWPRRPGIWMVLDAYDSQPTNNVLATPTHSPMRVVCWTSIIRDLTTGTNEIVDLSDWKCPDCIGEDTIPVVPEQDLTVNGSQSPELTPTARRSTAPKLARDLLPSQRGGIKPDSHSVFNQLVLDEDPMDGSRVLRKRKTSSAEADEHIISLRKRRKTNSIDAGPPEEGDPTDSRNDAEPSSRPQSSRTLRLKITQLPPRASLVTVQKKSRTNFVLAFRVNPVKLSQTLAASEKKREKRANRATTSRSSRPHSSAASVPTMTAPFISAHYSQPFYSFFDKETDELKGKPYGGTLTEAEADTSKTLPSPDDRRRFDEAKQTAENQWRERVEKMQADLAEPPARKQKKSTGPASQIECIEFGGWEIDTWYAAPYPEEYSRNRVLYICEFCLKYMNSDYVAWRHKLKCPAKHPPGDEIYRYSSVSVFEVDGRKNPVYCQNLCLLAKLFLGSKTLYYDVEPFLFYVLCEYDDLGYHFVGYFSKEKRASSQNNVSCILTLPIHQRKGYGNLLIDFSYLLTRVEQKTGSPEKPLSDMGLVSYRNYWRLIMCRYLLDHVSEDKAKKSGLSIRQISDDTGLTADDVISALEGLRCLARDPQTELYAFRVDFAYCRDYVAKWESKNYVKLNEHALTWTPYVMGRGNTTNFELGPAITAIAPREDDDEPKTTQAAVDVPVNGHGAVSPSNEGVDQQAADASVMESTEDQDNPKTNVDHPGPVGRADEADTEPPDVKMEDAVSGGATETRTPNGIEEWIAPYKDIPATRFQVYPSFGNARRSDRQRSNVGRPPVSRTASSSSRPKRTGGSSSRRSTTSRPKSSSKRRSVGGTGRGPGRWPKGTKKSDYGNADSGPGLPPAWLERNRLAVMKSPRANGMNGTADGEAQDEVQVKLKEPSSSGKGAKVEASAAALKAKAAEKRKKETDESDEEDEEEDEEEEEQDEEDDEGGGAEAADSSSELDEEEEDEEEEDDEEDE